LKNIIIAFIAALCGLLIILTGFTIHGRDTRQVELNNALKFSMEEAMTSLMYEEGKPQTEEEWKMSFLQSLVVQINSASDLTVTFIEADMEEGILSVEAVLEWNHPIGTRGAVSDTRTIILEEYIEEDSSNAPPETDESNESPPADENEEETTKPPNESTEAEESKPPGETEPESEPTDNVS